MYHQSIRVRIDSDSRMRIIQTTFHFPKVFPLTPLELIQSIERSRFSTYWAFGTHAITSTPTHITTIYLSYKVITLFYISQPTRRICFRFRRIKEANIALSYKFTITNILQYSYISKCRSPNTTNRRTYFSVVIAIVLKFTVRRVTSSEAVTAVSPSPSLNFELSSI